MTCRAIGQALGCYRASRSISRDGAGLSVFAARNRFLADLGTRRKHGFAWTDRLLGVAVAGEAPAHEEGFPSGNQRHLINLPVALAQATPLFT